MPWCSYHTTIYIWAYLPLFNLCISRESSVNSVKTVSSVSSSQRGATSISEGIFHCALCGNYRDRLCADHRILFFPVLTTLQKQTLVHFIVFGYLCLWFRYVDHTIQLQQSIPFTLYICPIQQRDRVVWSGSKERRPTKKYLNWRVEPKCSNSRRASTRLLKFYMFTFRLIVHTGKKSQDRCCCCS